MCVNMHGKVKKKIREINSSIEKAVQNHRLSLLQWETLASCVANQVNNLPKAVGSVTGNLECLDLLTPNRLLLGRATTRDVVTDWCSATTLRGSSNKMKKSSTRDLKCGC